ncbi:MAG: NADH-quinone oxidoreductase subunit A [Planctomycetia bacterium]|nr:NADH-quinone oxidoreductase subunit A [Planctomycetia bacterium]
MSPTSIAGYLALFFGFGFVFLFVNLLVGRLLRPKVPSVEKSQVYECGEPAIGSSFIQFDLRFYVIALLFIIFDVEVAFFFPWGVVFGKATHLMDPNVTGPAAVRVAQEKDTLSPAVLAVYDALAVPRHALPSPQDAAQVPETARTLALMSVFDILAFFAVLMVGFAYVWRRGDLDWVRALSLERAKELVPGRTIVEEEEPALAG